MIDLFKSFAFVSATIGISIFIVAVFRYLVEFGDRKIKKFEKHIQNQALNGNNYAIEFLLQGGYVKIDNIDIINEALNGNKNALKILRIKIEEKK